MEQSNYPIKNSPNNLEQPNHNSNIAYVPHQYTTNNRPKNWNKVI